MAFLRSVNPLDMGPVLHAGQVYLRAPQMSDFHSWMELRAASQGFLSPWEPTWPRDDLTKGSFRRRLRRYVRDVRDDMAYPFFIFDTDSDNIVGGLTLSNVRRGVAQSCALGYWIGERYCRCGHMSAAVGAIVPYVFKTLQLHRLEAACLPFNEASVRLLKRSGFVEEGYAQRYLRINGKWQDHLLFGLVVDDTNTFGAGS